MTTALGLVAAGLGVTVVPASMQRIALDGVFFRAIEDRAGLKGVLALGWRKNDASPALANFVVLVRRLAAARWPGLRSSSGQLLPNVRRHGNVDPTARADMRQERYAGVTATMEERS